MEQNQNEKQTTTKTTPNDVAFLEEVEKFLANDGHFAEIAQQEHPNTAIIVVAANTDTGRTIILHNGTVGTILQVLHMYLTNREDDATFDRLKIRTIKNALLHRALGIDLYTDREIPEDEKQK